MAFIRKPKEQEFAPADLVVACAHAGCEDAASARVKVRTGWANFCRGHYERHYSAKAAEFVGALGLTTLEDKRAYVEQHFAGIKGMA